MIFDELPGFRVRKTPIVGRYSAPILAMAIIFLHPERLQARSPHVALSEEEAIARAVARVSLADSIEGAIEIETGRGRVASAYPSPELSYQREQTFGDLGGSEDTLLISQTFDLSGSRRLNGRAGAARSRAVGKEGVAAKADIAVAARTRFYEILYRQHRVVALQGWAGQVEQAITIVRRREQRGDVATYDRRRLEREQAVAAGRLETERALLERARAHLSALIGGEAGELVVSGSLLPDIEPAKLTEMRAAARSRPELAALDLRIEAAALERKAASRWWVPALRLEGGWKGIDLGSEGRRDGFLVSASLSIPLWSRAAGAVQLAEGEARSASGRRALMVSEIDGELGGVFDQAIRLQRAAREFRQATSQASGELVRIAVAGYDGGELGLLELLDAYRGAAEDALSALDMEQSARQARIELDRLTGATLR